MHLLYLFYQITDLASESFYYFKSIALILLQMIFCIVNEL